MFLVQRNHFWKAGSVRVQQADAVGPGKQEPGNGRQARLGWRLRIETQGLEPQGRGKNEVQILMHIYGI